jgi:hypothetical protein
MSPFGPLKWLCPRASVARPHTTPSRIAVRIRGGVSPAITSAVARAARSTRSSSRPEARTRREAQRASSRECRPGAHAKRGAHAAERRRMVRRVEHRRSYDDRAHCANQANNSDDPTSGELAVRMWRRPIIRPPIQVHVLLRSSALEIDSANQWAAAAL